jgi:predicted AlkP superfamily phosphohydrolase/phosphomutase
MELLLVGIDAACAGVTDPLVRDGRIPTLARLFDEGERGPLRSQVPPWTASAWPSLYTGTNPGKHGVFGFLTFDGYDYDVVNATHVRERPLWHTLDHHGLSSVIVNVPVTGPPEPFDGALVPGYTAPEEPPCHPEDLLSEVRAAVGDYRVYPDWTGTDRTPTRDERVAEYCRLVGQRGSAFRYLAAAVDPDFGFVQFQQSDTVFHELPGDDDAVAEVYEAIDREVGAILDAVEPRIVVVASDHGMGRIGGHEYRVNEHLRREGLVTATRGAGGMPEWGDVRDGTLTGEDGPSLAARAMGAAASVGITSQRLAGVLSRLRLAGLVQRVVPDDVVRAGIERVDFPASQVYMRSRIECGVRINLAGREPAGVVSEAEYEPLRDRLVDLFRSVETPDGHPVFERVARREEVFEGPRVTDAPDVVVVPTDFDEFLSAQLRESVFGEPREPYNHKWDGEIVLSGPGTESASVEGAHLFDVAPTILALLGLPGDERMDGRSLVPEPEERIAYPAWDAGDRRETADETVEEHLEQLGYLDS